MRLLNTETLKLEEFGGNQVPPYAILSHKWGEYEITLPDVEADRARNMLGYSKIENTCSVAHKDGFGYVWIDTCCIDKTSSAELSEAINSMYRWYQEAEVCYAYLADVVPNAKSLESRWFTRGWTLQELIAPSNVIFLNEQWQEIGTKSSLRQELYNITRIPISILLGDDLNHASIAQRMSWASKRETTRVEDLAYCLMGIFSIHMPLLYGERERAFVRLQEEIMKISDDHSLFAWKSTEDHSGLLATSPIAFVDSGNFISSNSPGTPTAPLTVSNKGINLKLRFRSIGHKDLGLAFLHCKEDGKVDRWVAIYVRDVSQTKEYFTREHHEKLELLNPRDFSPSQYELRSICIEQGRPAQKRKLENLKKCVVR